jgi:ComF family protein
MPWQSSIREWTSTCIEALDTLLFPRHCAICGSAAIRSWLCGTCRQAVMSRSRPSCRRCATPLTGAVARGPAASSPVGCPFCRPGRPRFDAALALGPYRDELRDLCLRIKHVRAAWLIPHLAELLLEQEGGWLQSWIAAAAATGSPRPLVVPIALHWRRQLERRYNQSEALAHALARRLGLPRRNALVRVKATPKLQAMGRTERKAQMRRAFQVRPRARQAIAGRDIILVDDVLTTGATCNAAARVLKRAKARRILVVVIARASEYR